MTYHITETYDNETIKETHITVAGSRPDNRLHKEDMDDCETSPSVSVTRPTEIRMCCANTWTRLTCTFRCQQPSCRPKDIQSGRLESRPRSTLLQATPRHLQRGGSGKRLRQTQVKDINSTDLSQIYIQHPNWGTASAVDGHDHNYMGSKQITVPGSNKFLRDTLDLFSSHINVDIEIHGLPAPGEATRAGIPYKLSIEKSNAQTDFNNEINEDERVPATPNWCTTPRPASTTPTTSPSSAWTTTTCCPRLLYAPPSPGGRRRQHLGDWQHLQLPATAPQKH